MNWIKINLQKAKLNSDKKNIQIQFLWILVILASSIISYKLYKQQLIVDKAFVLYGMVSLLAAIIYFKPIILKPILLLWLLFGLFLGEITSTIILGIIYFFLFFPITFFLRITNKGNKIKSGWHTDLKKIDYEKLY